jgi:hypothetical protein
VCRNRQTLEGPSEAETTAQLVHSRVPEPIERWPPLGRSAQLLAALELWEVDDLHASNPLVWESPEHTSVQNDDAVETVVPAPQTPLASPLWPLCQAVTPRGA